jgi:dTDP-4-amino-4,6-dideoxygalactose transaminase
MRAEPPIELDFQPVHFLKALSLGTSHGRVVEDLESAFQERFSGHHAVMVPHARIGMLEVLQNIGAPKGSEVVLAPVTIPDIVNAIVISGLKPVFADLGNQTSGIDIDAFEAATGPSTAGWIVTHLSGFLVDMVRVRQATRQRHLFLIEDFSQALGACWNGTPAGTFGDAAVYSLTTLKPVSSFHGGLVLTDKRWLAETIRHRVSEWPREHLRTLIGWWTRDTILWLASHRGIFPWVTWPLLRWSRERFPEALRRVQIGAFGPWRNYDASIIRRERFPETLTRCYSDAQASIARILLDSLDDRIRRRRELGMALLRALEQRKVHGIVHLPRECSPSFWRFPWWPGNRSIEARRLARQGVAALFTNLPCLSREQSFQEFRSCCPNAENYCDQMIYLPLHSRMTQQDIEQMADLVALGEGKRS